MTEVLLLSGEPSAPRSRWRRLATAGLPALALLLLVCSCGKPASPEDTRPPQMIGSPIAEENHTTTAPAEDPMQRPDASLANQSAPALDGLAYRTVSMLPKNTPEFYMAKRLIYAKFDQPVDNRFEVKDVKIAGMHSIQAAPPMTIRYKLPIKPHESLAFSTYVKPGPHAAPVKFELTIISADGSNETTVYKDLVRPGDVKPASGFKWYIVPLDKYAGQKLNFYLATDLVTKGKPTDPIEAYWILPQLMTITN